MTDKNDREMNLYIKNLKPQTFAQWILLMNIWNVQQSTMLLQQKFLLSHVSPYGPPHKDTIATDGPETENNTKTFSSHSCTSSGSSKAENMGADLEDILKMGSSTQKSALTRFFSKELEYMDKNNGCWNYCEQFRKLNFEKAIYDTTVNIHHQKYFQSAFQFQISLIYFHLRMQLVRNYKLNE